MFGHRGHLVVRDVSRPQVTDPETDVNVGGVGERKCSRKHLHKTSGDASECPRTRHGRVREGVQGGNSCLTSVTSYHGITGDDTSLHQTETPTKTEEKCLRGPFVAEEKGDV